MGGLEITKEFLIIPYGGLGSYQGILYNSIWVVWYGQGDDKGIHSNGWLRDY